MLFHYHVQTNNRDNFLSTDFGLSEFNVKSEKERIRKYRRYVYEAGAVTRPEKGKTPEKYAPLSHVNSTGQAKIIGNRILEKERKREFELRRNDRFRYRTRYFTDSGVIGSKEFVSKTYNSRPDGVFQPLLCGVSRLLFEKGVSHRIQATGGKI